MRSQWERNAREAWQYWLNVRAPDSWIAAYHEARGKPWLNPRLSIADKFRLRYALDLVYAARERDRASAKRFVNPQYGARWARNPDRWRSALKNADGSVTRAAVKRLHLETHCTYCGCLLDERHIDHVRAIANGGTHSADNLVAACEPCNLEKAAMLPLAWFAIVAARGGNLRRFCST
jgi:HNH endonuclease